MAVLIYSIILNSMVVEYPQSGCIETTANAVNNVALIQTSASSTTSELTNFSQIVAHVLREALISIAPLFALFVIFQIFLLKMTRRQVIRIIIGFIYAFTGLTIFLVGVNSGFSQTGAELGEKLGLMAIERGGIWYFILILIKQTTMMTTRWKMSWMSILGDGRRSINVSVRPSL